MSTKLAMAMYKPKEGKSAELKAILKDHIPMLQKLELISANTAYMVESQNGTVIEIFEWMDDSAKDVAHKHPAVRAIWGKMMDICSFPHLQDLPEAKHSFPNFSVLS